MNTDTATSRSTQIKKKYGLLLAGFMIICVFATACFVCTLQYSNAKRDILAAQKNELASWVAGTVEAISMWTAALDTQSKRVSTSELYRLFALEVAQLGGGAAAVINDSDDIKNAPEGLASLSEQVPMMRNLLLDYMNLNGFTDVRIVNAEGQTLLSALTRPSPVTDGQRAAVAQALSAGKVAYAPIRASQSGLMLDLADPLRAVLARDNSDAPVAALLLSMPVTGNLAQFLSRDIRQTGTFIPRFVQKQGSSFEQILVQSAQPVPVPNNLLPLDAAGTLPFGERVGLDGSTPVYSLGSKVPGVDWWVILEVPAQEVDARLKTQAWLIFGIGGLIGLGVLLLFSLLWWVVVGREQRAVAQRFESLYTIIKQQKQLLDSVNVSLDVGLLLVDAGGQVQVCNRAFAAIVQREEEELPGQTLRSLFDPASCAQLLEGIRGVAANGKNISLEVALHAGEEQRLFRVTLFHFMDDDARYASGGAVAIFQDITEFRRASEQRRQQQLNTIAALVRAVESVDPYLGGRSQKMVQLGTLLSGQMELEEEDRETIRAAASLSQMGKLFVPRDLLTKNGKYTPEEQNEIQRAPDFAYNVLRDIDFGLPVSKAVYQMSERMDGQGYPKHLQGEEISIHARVLAVLNAFCAMVSPRSYRTGMSALEALDRLRAESNSFDQRVVNALERVLNSPEGEALLAAENIRKEASLA